MNIKYDAIIVASGKGERAGLPYNKVFYRLSNGLSVLENAMQPFLNDKDCLSCIVVLQENELSNIKQQGKIKICVGGKRRLDSVYNGLKLVSSDYVFVHDGARPYLKKEDLERLKIDVSLNKASILAIPCSDSPKLVRNNYIISNLKRTEIYLAQTPQACLTNYLKEAYKNRDINKDYTDEASLLADNNISISLVIGSLTNKKITYPEDLK